MFQRLSERQTLVSQNHGGYGKLLRYATESLIVFVGIIAVYFSHATETVSELYCCIPQREVCVAVSIEKGNLKCYHFFIRIPR